MIKTNKTVLWVLAAFLAVLALFAAVAVSCGKRKARVPTLVPPATAPAPGRETSRRIPSLEELLRQLRNLEKPPGGDPKLWAAMKS